MNDTHVIPLSTRAENRIDHMPQAVLKFRAAGHALRRIIDGDEGKEPGLLEEGKVLKKTLRGLVPDDD